MRLVYIKEAFADFISSLHYKLNLPASFSLFFLDFQLAVFDIKLSLSRYCSFHAYLMVPDPYIARINTNTCTLKIILTSQCEKDGIMLTIQGGASNNYGRQVAAPDSSIIDFS